MARSTMSTGTTPTTVQFWLGRAGSGKTYGCLEAIARELHNGPCGLPLVLLAPEQSTATLERRLIEWPGSRIGFTRARVMSFEQVMREALAQAGPTTQGEALGEAGRIMLLRHLLTRLRPQLQVFNQPYGRTGLTERLSATLLEFERYGWQPGALATLSGDFAQNPAGKRDLLGSKLHDLGLLWTAYREALEEGGWLDGAKRPTIAARAIEVMPEWDGVSLWVDGFASFTEQELTLLDALSARAQQVTIALCCDPSGDPARAPANEQPAPRRIARTGAERLFENVDESFEQLRRRYELRGCRTLVKALPTVPDATRFAQSPALAHLERAVLGRLRPTVFSGEGNASDTFELIEASDLRAEVEALARRIVALCRSENEATPPTLAWREIGVLARDLTPYSELIEEVFAQFEIPCFIDQPRQTERHPLARLLHSALTVLERGWQGRAFIQYLKTSLAGLNNPDAVALLENHIIERGPETAQWRMGEMSNLAAHLNECYPHAGDWQVQLEEAITPLEALDAQLRTGVNPARALWELLATLGVREALEGWILAAREAGREGEAMLHEQAWEETLGWLEALDALATRQALAFDEAEGNYREWLQGMGEIIESILAATRARLVPPTLNQVIVGSVERSRTPELDTVFVLGMNEAMWPRLWTPDPILGDEERERMIGAPDAGRQLGPDSESRMRQEHYLVYIALTRASRRLVLSRPLLDAEGKATDPAPVFKQIAKAFPALRSCSVGRSGENERSGSALRPEEWLLGIGRAWQRFQQNGLAGNLTAAMSGGHPLAREELTAAQRQRLMHAAASLAPHRPAALDPGAAHRYWSRRPRLSITALERYGECPYRFFAGQMLRLGERKETTLGPRERGNLIHQWLQKIFEEMSRGEGLNWAEIDPERVDTLIERERAALETDPEWLVRLDADPLARSVVRGWAKDLKRIVRGLRWVARRGRLTQCASELKFGSEHRFTFTASGIEFELRGVIDRVDRVVLEAGEDAIHPEGSEVYLLIDYKNSGKKFDKVRILEGIDLQLVSYALALAQWILPSASTPPLRMSERPVRLGGIFYWPLKNTLLEANPERTPAVATQPDPESLERDWVKSHRPTGAFEIDLADALDGEVEPKSSSVAFAFNRKQNGELGASGNSWAPESLDHLIAWQAEQLHARLTAIAAGEIAARPYRIGKAMPCTNCDFEGLCRHREPGATRARVMKTGKASDADERFAEIGVTKGTTKGTTKGAAK